MEGRESAGVRAAIEGRRMVLVEREGSKRVDILGQVDLVVPRVLLYDEIGRVTEDSLVIRYSISLRRQLWRWNGFVYFES